MCAGRPDTHPSGRRPTWGEGGSARSTPSRIASTMLLKCSCSAPVRRRLPIAAGSPLERDGIADQDRRQGAYFDVRPCGKVVRSSFVLNRYDILYDSGPFNVGHSTTASSPQGSRIRSTQGSGGRSASCQVRRGRAGRDQQHKRRGHLALVCSARGPIMTVRCPREGRVEECDCANMCLLHWQPPS